MAGGSTCTSISRHVIGSATVELSRTGNRNSSGVVSFSSRIFMKSNRAASAMSSVAEGPSCIYVGPIETASKETLEALYRQARDAYYSGEPLIVDDMFDRVELKLRWYGSKSVVKYPRCSIRRQSTYADAEDDISQVFALASIWMVFLAIGSSLCVGPIIYTFILAYQDAISSKISQGSQASVIQFLATVNSIFFMAVGSLIGYPIASSSVKVLQGLWRNDLVALKGACPNCGEEVFAFVKSDQSNNSPHRADCHVCESLLEFRTKVEVIAHVVIEYHSVALGKLKNDIVTIKSLCICCYVAASEPIQDWVENGYMAAYTLYHEDGIDGSKNSAYYNQLQNFVQFLDSFETLFFHD